MRTKVTLILLFLNVALFFFIFRFERRWRTEDAWKEARRRVLGAEAADIRAIEISGAGRKLALARRGDAWFLTSPLDWPANPSAVDRIVKELQFLEHESSFSVSELARNNQSLAGYGLDQPKLTVAISSGAAGAQPTVLRLGDTTPDGIRLYILSPDGERVHVVSQSLARSLALGFEELHSDIVFSIPVFEANSLNLQTAAPASLRIRLRRYGNRWAFEAPMVARASKNATELAINALDSLRVKSFVTQNPPASLPSEKPSLRLTLEGNNRRETVFLGDALGATAIPESASATAGAGPRATEPDIEYYAQFEGRPALFTVAIPARLKAALDTAQESLRETRILDFDPRAVTALSLAAPGQPPLALQRLVETGQQAAESASWQIVLPAEGAQGPLTRPADRAAVSRLLEQLSLFSAKKFASDAPRDADLESWGFNRPERTVVLTLDGSPPVTLELGLDAQRAAFARLAGAAASASVYEVDPEILREIPVVPRAWRDRLLRELPPGARIAALKLTDLADNKVLLDTAIDAAGRPAQPGPAPEAVTAVLAQLRALRAKEFVLDQFVDRVAVAGDDRAWRYRLDTSVTLTGGAGEQTSTTSLFLTVRVGGDRQLAGSPEFQTVFAIEQPLLDALWKITEAPRDPGPPK